MAKAGKVTITLRGIEENGKRLVVVELGQLANWLKQPHDNNREYSPATLDRVAEYFLEERDTFLEELAEEDIIESDLDAHLSHDEELDEENESNWEDHEEDDDY